jgi:hypothetical protein
VPNLVINQYKLKVEHRNTLNTHKYIIVAPIAVLYTCASTLEVHHFNCHSCMHMIETEPAEWEPELQVEQVPVEDVTNISS